MAPRTLTLRKLWTFSIAFSKMVFTSLGKEPCSRQDAAKERRRLLRLRSLIPSIQRYSFGSLPSILKARGWRSVHQRHDGSNDADDYGGDGRKQSPQSVFKSPLFASHASEFCFQNFSFPLRYPFSRFGLRRIIDRNIFVIADSDFSAAIRRASSLSMRLAAARRPGSSS
jgi:hypothetical protein